MCFELKKRGAYVEIPAPRKLETNMKLISAAFEEGEMIPLEYTLYGDNEIPPLAVEGVPRKTQSLALIVEDPGTANGTFTHWLLFNISPEAEEIVEEGAPPGARQGLNDFGIVEYGGPKPPDGEHRYYFKLYALDIMLDLKDGAERDEIEAAMEGHVLAEATLMGRCARPEMARR
jgi:Raf kinase inhibitor-like YbhB/YbcL family protein